VTLLLHRRSYVSVVFVIAQTQLKKSVPLWCLLGGRSSGAAVADSARAILGRVRTRGYPTTALVCCVSVSTVAGEGRWDDAWQSVSFTEPIPLMMATSTH
jgi:hypothetical protein